jgi:hypothetical protein
MKIVGEAWRRLSKEEQSRWCFDPPAPKEKDAGDTKVVKGGPSGAWPETGGAGEIGGGSGLGGAAGCMGQGWSGLNLSPASAAVNLSEGMVVGGRVAELTQVSLEMLNKPNLVAPPPPPPGVDTPPKPKKRAVFKDESRYDLFVKAMAVRLQMEEPHLLQTERMRRIGQV